MDEYSALFRVLGYLFCAVLMAQTAIVAKRMRVALIITAGNLVLQSVGALLIFLHRVEIRDFVLNWIATPYIALVALTWLNTFWRVGKDAR